MNGVLGRESSRFTPFLATRIDAGFINLLLIPRAWTTEQAIALATKHALRNRMITCLDTTDADTLVFLPNGSVTIERGFSEPTTVVTGMLRPGIPLEDSDELTLRQTALAEYIDGRPKAYVTGDLLKAGRIVPDEERTAMLVGRQNSGPPKGLSRCPECNEWQGVCLDPNPDAGTLLLRVFCVCDNWTLCAACGLPLFDRRLQACYYEPKDRMIWYVPGFSASRHRCPTS